ncbi:hypothetical protein [Amycolatopsis cihanbeyliensis]|uniref:hypothetical protein n=1 Tax=Amycolatopsis cihanbeyliensis TaxID=1128664 RepID=UPI0011548514|nr:hypothetical protein [Amycolatopsis cihanbeyliensis]
MTWARQAGSSRPAEDKSWLAGVKAEERERMEVRDGLAARTVAGHCKDAQECAELLAMLGLDASSGRRSVTG